MISLISIIQNLFADPLENLFLIRVFGTCRWEVAICLFLKLIKRPKWIIKSKFSFSLFFISLEDGSRVLHIDNKFAPEFCFPFIEGSDSDGNLYTHYIKYNKIKSFIILSYLIKLIGIEETLRIKSRLKRIDGHHIGAQCLYDQVILVRLAIQQEHHSPNIHFLPDVLPDISVFEHQTDQHYLHHHLHAHQEYNKPQKGSLDVGS